MIGLSFVSREESRSMRAWRERAFFFFFGRFSGGGKQFSSKPPEASKKKIDCDMIGTRDARPALAGL